MNILAHALLALNHPERAAGNFLADFLRGSAFQSLPPALQHGVQMHRFIDAFTDHHPVVIDLSNQLKPYFNRYAPVAVDVYFDHMLARNWQQFHSAPLETFAAFFYQVLHTQIGWFPERARNALEHMSTHNWLVGYGHVEGMRRSFHGMTRRAKFSTGFEQALYVLELKNEAIEIAFLTFFPQLQQEVDRYLATNSDFQLS